MKVRNLLWAADDGSGGGGDDPNPGDQDSGGDSNGDGGETDVQTPITEEAVATMIAEATKGLKDELKKRDKKITDLNQQLKNQGLSAEEQLKAKEQEIADRESKVDQAEIQLSATKALAAAGLDVGWADIVVFPDADSIPNVVKTIKDSMADGIQTQVTERLKAAGINPRDSGGGKPDPTDQRPNPWAKDTFNLTEQMKITKEDPKLAAKLQKAAGG